MGKTGRFRNGSASDTATPSDTMRREGIGAVPSSSCRAVWRHRPFNLNLTQNSNIKTSMCEWRCKLRRNDRMTEVKAPSVCVVINAAIKLLVLHVLHAHSFHWCSDWCF